jgi:predicted amidohydrolase YtcJ
MFQQGKVTALTLATLATLAQAVAQAALADTADKIWVGGPILTMNDNAMRAEAVAVKDGRILAVGKQDDVLATKGEKTEIIDLGGRALLPGFVDAHGHVMMGGLQALAANMLAPPDGKVTDIAGLLQTLKDWADANKETVTKAKLILGFGYDQSQLKELRAPTKEELDTVSTEFPVVVVHQSGHFGALNSKALEIAGYTSETKDPEGGVIQRKPATTEPNGVLEETAWIGVVPKLLGNIGPAGMRVLAEAGADMWTSYGYTTAQEGRSNKAVDSVFRAVADDGKLKIDVVSYPDVLLGRDHIKENVSADYKNGFRIGGAKLTIDGSPQGFTAWRDRPYYAPVGNFPKGYLGYPAATGEQTIGAIDWAYENKIQMLVHVSGEAAGDLMITGLRLAENKHGSGDRRPVLIHGHFEREDQVDSFVRLGVFPSLFPMHTYYWGDWHRDHTVGPDLAQNISPTGWYLKRGSKFSSHHDAPVAFPDSMRILDATVTRRSRSGDIIGPLQRIDVITALKGMTIWPAYQHFEEKNKGSIETGKLADFVVLSAGPTGVDPDTLDQLTVTETIKKGNTIFVRGQKRTELMRPRDFVNTGLYEMLKQVYIHERVRNLPAAYRTPMAVAAIASTYDDCFGSIMLAEMTGGQSSLGELAAQ